MNAIGNFFFALGKLLGLIEKKQRKDEQEHAENEHEKMERDPADWWKSNFDRVPGDADMPDNGQGAGKADDTH